MDFSSTSSTIKQKLNLLSRKRSISRFIFQLFQLLENNEHPNIITWSEEGTQFIIKNVLLFTNTILPRIYSHQNFTSFTRQLNMYLFKKNKEFGYFYCYTHPFFQRGRRDLLSQVVRRKSQTKDAKTVLSHNNNNQKQLIQVETSRNLNIWDIEALQYSNIEMKTKEKRLLSELQAAQATIVQLHKENRRLSDEAKRLMQDGTQHQYQRYEGQQSSASFVDIDLDCGEHVENLSVENPFLEEHHRMPSIPYEPKFDKFEF